MAGAAGVRPFASAAVMPQTETGTYLWCRKVVESQFDSCQQQSRRTGISAPYVRFFGEDMHGITVFASLPGNPDTPSEDETKSSFNCRSGGRYKTAQGRASINSFNMIHSVLWGRPAGRPRSEFRRLSLSFSWCSYPFCPLSWRLWFWLSPALRPRRYARRDGRCASCIPRRIALS